MTSGSSRDGVEEFLAYIAGKAAGYSSGMKWNEKEKLKADMMNRPERWRGVTANEVRTMCRELGMLPDDMDTISELLKRRKEGRRFVVRHPYQHYQFDQSR
ncbi:hypothetical protein [Arthrobacter sp. RAF14]|uniref:hypothetical protein n=1 Tax=Arthrobacter sp. RAF14 TaxID=3233051 RepID=UPI003F8EA85E